MLPTGSSTGSSTLRRQLLARLACAAAPACIGGSPLAAQAQTAPAQPGERVSWPQVSLLDGQQFGPEQARDHAVVVVFWSLTCGFCIRHNSHLTRLQDSLPAGSRLRIVTAVREPDAQAVRRHMARHGHRFAVTLEAGKLASALSTRRISPLTVTVDRRGHLLQVIPGEMFEDDVMALARLAE
jgi:thiol-disulfide isomerase/thioredoxin